MSKLRALLDFLNEKRGEGWTLDRLHHFDGDKDGHGVGANEVYTHVDTTDILMVNRTYNKKPLLAGEDLVKQWWHKRVATK